MPSISDEASSLGIHSQHKQFYAQLCSHYEKLAKKHDLDFFSLESIKIDLNLLNKSQRADYLRLRSIPIEETNKTLTIATADPKNQEAIKAFLGSNTNKHLKIVVTTMQDITDALAKRFAKEYTYDISYKLHDMDPKHSPNYTFSLAEKVVVISLFIVLTALAVIDFYPVVVYFILFLSTITLVLMIYKFYLSSISFKWKLNEKKTHELPEIYDSELPPYTILIPLFHETEAIIEQLVQAIKSIDYPVEKLDVKLLLECNDEETFNSIKQIDIPIYFQILQVPLGKPQTKPRACNYGLEFALGDYLVIYDAEDKPEVEQLKKAVQGFLMGNDKLVCLQAALNYYNRKDNVLTRLFTLEYSHWFDQLIPGLAFLDLPVPLGGTSNHFKTEFLRKIGGWAPSIGTEDAEIGVRLYRKGYRTQCIHSTTFEEASSTISNWFWQRVRWNKGYMQTFLVHMRDPIKFYKQIGARAFTSFILFVGGNVFISMANLLLWIFFITDMFEPRFKQVSYSYAIVINLAFTNFMIANIILAASQFAAAYKRKFMNIIGSSPLIPVYWALMSLAGYFAVYQLLVKPSYWYKTQHGDSPTFKKILEKVRKKNVSRRKTY